MTPRSVRFLALLALAAACGTPEVPYTPPPSAVVSAVFDPIAGQIPLPNDLALAQVPASLPPAQQDLLNAFKAQGGFPNDQEVPVTISLVRTSIAADGSTSNSPPTLDTTTLTPANLVVVLQTAQAAGPVALDPITDANYVNGLLTLHNKNRAPWTPGHYVVGIRGGPNGVKTKEGDPIVASSTFYLIAQGQNLETDEGITLLSAQTGSREAAVAAAQQLDQIINGYKQGPFQAVDQVFPHQELAAMTTFAVAPLKTQVQLDANRGLVPLPIDLLRDATGHISAQGACALAQGTFNAATGACTDSHGNPNTAAGAFQTLDGFSTTGLILSPLSDLVQASTITSTTVTLWDLKNPAAPVQVNASTYITEPSEVTQQGLSPVIALQPAGATASDPTSVFRTRPLKDNSDYAVVITDGVKDKVGKPIGPGTAATILTFTNPVSVNGNSQLAGVDNATAAGLEAMRLKLAPLVAMPAFKGHVAMAYTFHTQTILSTAVQLGALPYTKAPTTGVPAAPTPLTMANAFAKYGVDAASVPNTGNVAEVLETTLTTFNLINPANGAFNPSGATTDETINVLIAYPNAATVTFPACPANLAPFGKKCSPLVVFRHGLGRGRADILTVADTLAGKGFTVVAVDAAKHGDRSFCISGQTNVAGTSIPQCFGAGATCNAIPGTAGQGDANPPGTCSTGFTYQAVSPACNASPAACGWTGTQGIPVVSSSFLVSANFFRTRDTLRQDIIDQSQVVRAIAFAPSGAPPTGHTIFDYLFTKGVVIDPAQIYFVGQSLGAIQGTVDVATNPRMSKAVLNVGGGTVVDVFTTSPAFAANTNLLLASLGIQPGANSAYLQFLVVAKTILDPADPVNFAGHLSANTLPNLLPPLGGNPNGTVPQAAKSILTQAAFCDQTVPNPWNFVLDSNAGSTPLPPTGAPGTFELFFTGTTPPGLTDCPSPTSGLPPPASSVSHGFLTSWASTSGSGATAQGQSRAAGFLGGTPSPSSVVPVQ